MKKLLLALILLTSFTLGGQVAHAQTASGSVPPGGACKIDDDCEDVGTQTYGCSPSGICTPNGDNPTATVSGATSANQQPTTEDAINCASLSTDGQSCTRANPDGTTTVCGVAVDGTQHAMTSYCKVVYPDKSYTIINAGANTATNFNSAGVQTGTQNNSGLAPVNTGTSQNAQVGVSNPDGGCNILNNFNTTGCLADLTEPIINVVAFLLGVVGNVFNWIIVITVFQYASYFANSTGMFIAWGILRDLGNIVLLFGFILMGVMMILDLHNVDAKKAIPTLIIAAVLLNFSLFGAEAVVDVANALSATLYKQAGQSIGSNTTASLSNQLQNGNSNVGIAGLIIHDTYADSALSPAKVPTVANNRLLAYIATIVFYGIVMMILLAGCVVFVTRAVMLTILLVVSPIGVVGMAIPQFQNMGRQWFQRLMQNAFFAPIFLLMIFVGLKVMEAVRNSLNIHETLATALSSPDVNSGGILMLFVLTVGFFVAAFQFAKGSSVAGASFATSFAQNTVTRAARAPFRATASGTAFIGRRTVGRRFAETADKWRKEGRDQTELGRFAVGLMDKGAHASFDVRSNKTIQAALGGNVAKGGFHAIEKKAVDERVNHAKTLKNTEAQKRTVEGLERNMRNLDDDWNEDKTKFNKLIKEARDRGATIEEISRLRNDKNSAEANYLREKKALSDRVFDASAQGTYAKNLAKGNPIFNVTNTGDIITVQNLADHHAIDAIKKNHNKTDFDKALAALGAGNTKTPSTTPPAGGGGGGDH